MLHRLLCNKLFHCGVIKNDHISQKAHDWQLQILTHLCVSVKILSITISPNFLLPTTTLRLLCQWPCSLSYEICSLARQPLPSVLRLLHNQQYRGLRGRGGLVRLRCSTQVNLSSDLFFECITHTDCRVAIHAKTKIHL